MNAESILRHNRRVVPSLRSRVAFVFLCLVLLGCLSCHRAETDVSGNETDSVEKNFDASFKRANFPWYSSGEKGVVFLREPEVKKKEIRARKPKYRRSFGVDDGTGNAGGLWGKVVALWLPIAFLVVILGVLALYAVRQNRVRMLRRRLREEELKRRRRRIETLAVEARDRYDDLEKAAEEALALDDLRSALVFYFSWILVEMDKRDVVLMDKGKTNLEYWRELEDAPRLRDLYRSVMVDFERVYFGGLAISREEFDKVWNLRDTFKQLMFEEDERKERLLREREEAQRLADLKKWQGPGAMSVLIFVLCSAFLTTGCKREATWRGEYSLPVAVYPMSLNDVSLFGNYCSKQNPDRVYELRSRFGNINGDFDKCDTIVWFCTSSTYGTGVWNLTSPRELNEYVRDSFWLNEETDDETEEQDSGTLEKARMEAWKACLERYASATEEDWTDYFVPLSNVAFYKPGLSNYQKKPLDELVKETSQQRIRNWLKGKAGRKCVVVLADQNSERDYWRAAREYVERSFDEPLRSKSLKECDDRLEGTLTSKDTTYSIFTNSTPYGYLPDVLNNQNRTAMQSRAKDARKLLALLPLMNDVSTPDEVLTKVSELKKELEGADLSSEKMAELEALLARDHDAKELLERLTSVSENEQTGSIDEESYSVPNGDEIVFDDDFPEEQDTNAALRSALLSLFPSATPYSAEEFLWSGMDFGDDFEPDSPLYRPELWFRQSFIEWSNEDLPHEEAFSGDPTWTSGLPEKALCREKFRLIPAEGTETLLALGDTPLVCQRKVDDGTLYFVNSTTFLSNFGLTDSTNRRIADRLTREFNPEGRIGFLAAEEFDYQEVHADTKSRYVHKKPYGRFTLTKVSPFTIFIWHATVLTMLAGFCVWPIFGRARRVVRDKTSDFGMHVDATAFLLKSADSVSWAREQIDACRRYRKRDGAWGFVDEQTSEPPADLDSSDSSDQS